MKKVLIVVGIICGLLILSAITIKIFNTDRFSMTENLKV